MGKGRPIEEVFEACLAQVDEGELELARSLEVDFPALTYIRLRCGLSDQLKPIAESYGLYTTESMCKYLSQVYGESIGTVELILMRGLIHESSDSDRLL
jgi:hypothetical protein